MRRKPPELEARHVKDESAKRFIHGVKEIGNGCLFVYQWNLDKSETAPIGLYVDANLTEEIACALETLGAKKTVIKDGSKLDLSTVTGFPGSHMEI